MKIALVSGSHRPNGRSGYVARFASDLLKKEGADTEIFDLGKTPLPLWDESIWAKTGKPWNDDWSRMSATLQTCDGIVVVSPEWAGMVPPALKNFFLLCGRRELGHKPGLIIGLSSGMGGAYPIAELRISSYKNNYLCYLPEHLIIRHGDKVLNGDTPIDDNDRLTRERMAYSLQLLMMYAKALAPIRGTDLVSKSPWTNGM